MSMFTFCLQVQAKALTKRLQNAKEKLAILQNAQTEDVPVNISALEHAISVCLLLRSFKLLLHFMRCRK